MSEAYSLPKWQSLQFCLVAEKCRLGNAILKKGKRENWSPAWKTCSSWIFKPWHPNSPWGQPGEEPGTSPYWSCMWHSIAQMLASRQVLLHTWPQLSPCLFFQLSQLASHFLTSYYLLFPPLNHIYFTSHLILSVQTPSILPLWWHVLFSSREQIIISKFPNYFLQYFSACLDALLTGLDLLLWRFTVTYKLFLFVPACEVSCDVSWENWL